VITDTLARIRPRAVMLAGLGLGAVGGGAVMQATNAGKGTSDGGILLGTGMVLGGSVVMIGAPVLASAVSSKVGPLGPFQTVAASDAAENVTKGWRDLQWSQKASRLGVLFTGIAVGSLLGEVVGGDVIGTRYEQGPFASAVEAPERHRKELTRAALVGAPILALGTAVALTRNKTMATRVAGLVDASGAAGVGAWFGMNSLGMLTPAPNYNLDPPKDMTIPQLAQTYMRVHDANHDHKVTLAEENHDGNLVEWSALHGRAATATEPQIEAEMRGWDHNHDNHLDTSTWDGATTDEWTEFKNTYQFPYP
jgi:hypothetical protein